MAIGTSLGAYYEDEFHHQAGIETPPEVIKPGNTGDDNERTVEGDMNQKANTDKPQPISDVYDINPMNTTQNSDSGVIPMLGAPERIGPAALIIKGKTYTGQNHGEAFEKFMQEDPTGNTGTYQDGFMTTKGRFLSREESMDLIKANDMNQLKPQVKDAINRMTKEDYEATWLLSEDMKPETRTMK